MARRARVGDLSAPGGLEALTSALRGLVADRSLSEGEANWRVAMALGRACCVRETLSFATGELGATGAPAVYTLRETGQRILLRHNGSDVVVLAEIELERLYDPPPPIASRLAGLERPLVLDVGANVGLFGLHVLAHHPGARVRAYEPDPANAAIHRGVMGLNPSKDWELVQACAGARNGTTPFLAGLGAASQIVRRATAGTITVPLHDVLDSFAEADLVKIDIEGGEWAMLEDPRFGRARVVVLEYHPDLDRHPDAETAATALLTGHGYRLVPIMKRDNGVGMVWAYQP